MLSEVNKFLRYAKVYKKYCHSEPSGERIQPIQNNLSCGNASLIPPYKLRMRTKYFSLAHLGRELEIGALIITA